MSIFSSAKQYSAAEGVAEVIVMSQGSGNIEKSLSVRTNEPLNSNAEAFTPKSEIDF